MVQDSEVATELKNNRKNNMKTKQEKIESIRKACIAANPSILDLEFGCAVKFDYEELDGSITDDIIVDNFVSGLKTANNSIFYFFNKGIEESDFNRTWERQKKEIIGRKIRLADVLHMIEKKLVQDRMPLKPHWDAQHNLLCTYNLLKDDLTLQDEATIDFIYQLIESK